MNAGYRRHRHGSRRLSIVSDGYFFTFASFITESGTSP